MQVSLPLQVSGNIDAKFSQKLTTAPIIKTGAACTIKVTFHRLLSYRPIVGQVIQPFIAFEKIKMVANPLKLYISYLLHPR